MTYSIEISNISITKFLLKCGANPVYNINDKYNIFKCINHDKNTGKILQILNKNPVLNKINKNLVTEFINNQYV